MITMYVALIIVNLEYTIMCCVMLYYHGALIKVLIMFLPIAISLPH